MNTPFQTGPRNNSRIQRLADKKINGTIKDDFVGPNLDTGLWIPNYLNSATYSVSNGLRITECQRADVNNVFRFKPAVGRRTKIAVSLSMLNDVNAKWSRIYLGFARLGQPLFVGIQIGDYWAAERRIRVNRVLNNLTFSILYDLSGASVFNTGEFKPIIWCEDDYYYARIFDREYSFGLQTGEDIYACISITAGNGYTFLPWTVLSFEMEYF